MFFITGSSSGIGQHVAVEYGKEGAKVVIHGRNAKGLQVNSFTLLAFMFFISVFIQKLFKFF